MGRVLCFPGLLLFASSWNIPNTLVLWLGRHSRRFLLLFSTILCILSSPRVIIIIVRHGRLLGTEHQQHENDVSERVSESAFFYIASVALYSFCSWFVYAHCHCTTTLCTRRSDFHHLLDARISRHANMILFGQSGWEESTAHKVSSRKLFGT
jgi:hypothetical protein